MGGSQWPMEREAQPKGEEEETNGSQEQRQGAVEGQAIPAEEQGDTAGVMRGRSWSKKKTHVAHLFL